MGCSKRRCCRLMRLLLVSLQILYFYFSIYTSNLSTFITLLPLLCLLDLKWNSTLPVWCEAVRCNLSSSLCLCSREMFIKDGTKFRLDYQDPSFITALHFILFSKKSSRPMRLLWFTLILILYQFNHVKNMKTILIQKRNCVIMYILYCI